jgi:tetratricopeptide (TPR) repeat protein
MIEQQTVESAKEWVRTGENWITKGAPNLGMNYLDKAIPVFREVGDDAWLTYTLHQKLKAYREQNQYEQVEQLFDEVMAGYMRLEDNYGKGLLLMHRAESNAQEGQPDRALATLNMALEISERDALKDLCAYILRDMAEVYHERGSFVQAVRLLRQAELHLDEIEHAHESVHVRQLIAESLAAMGEQGEAIALLEDVQSKLQAAERYRELVKPLTLLSKLYGATGATADKERVGQLLHWSAQRVIHEDVPPDTRPSPRRYSALIGGKRRR